MWTKHHPKEPNPYTKRGRAQIKRAKKSKVTPKDLPYDKYLLTSHWKRLRSKILSERGNKCEACCSSDKLHVHHRTYYEGGQSILFGEKRKHLTVLCESCHKKIHYYHLEQELIDNEHYCFLRLRTLQSVDTFKQIGNP